MLAEIMQPMGPLPGPPPPPQGWPAPGERQRQHQPPSTDGKAVASLVLGILSMVMGCWLGAPLGVPAVLLGALAHRDIRRSEGLTGGRGLATAGIVLGSIAATLFVVGWGGFLAFAIIGATRSTPVPPPHPVLGPPTAATTATPVSPPGGWGAIHVVALHTSPSKPLRAQLAEEVSAGKLAGETVLVQTIAPSCAACVEIANAMRDPALQAALEHVRLVRVDVDEFGVEAQAIHLDEAELPWFYLVDAHGSLRDGISADEWDDNDAEQMAPALDAFLRGKLRSRRRAWRGGTTL
jgi:hypothetical protein